MPEASAPTMPAEQHRTPAEAGMWMFVLADLCVFATYFAVFLVDRANHRTLFAEGQAGMARHLGGLNTLLLLISSWGMARAVAAARDGSLARFQQGLSHAILCGLSFLVVKTIEYRAKFAAGLGIDTNVFYRDYFAFTGFHLLHVVVGLSLVAWCRFAFRTPASLREHVGFVEGTGLYWHMVDLVWVVLFALVYLVPS